MVELKQQDVVCFFASVLQHASSELPSAARADARRLDWQPALANASSYAIAARESCRTVS